jgi:dCTP deaminase
MSILTDAEILAGIEDKSIIIEPFNKERLGTNSYDVCLSKVLGVYQDEIIDAKKSNPVNYFEIPEEGFVLLPGELYLGVTSEYTETHKCVPFLEGKSSTGRLGISIHATAGKGDIGFQGTWTLEISVVKKVRIYAGMPIGQLIYFTASENVITPYNKKKNAKYNGQKHDTPEGSKMYQNDF